MKPTKDDCGKRAQGCGCKICWGSMERYQAKKMKALQRIVKWERLLEVSKTERGHENLISGICRLQSKYGITGEEIHAARFLSSGS